LQAALLVELLGSRWSEPALHSYCEGARDVSALSQCERSLYITEATINGILSLDILKMGCV
jgi:hypothetical protein